MKKKIFSLILTGIMSLSLALSSCQYILPKSVVNASLNEKGELILTYSDKTTQNVGVVKGEDGKDGVDGKDGLNGENGKDLTACEHVYGNWETGLAPSCTSIGYDTRVCALCGDLDYQFTNPLGHNYENAKDVVSIPGEQHLVNKTCSLCGDTIIVEHNYNENGICSTCGEITHFIESEEYIEDIIIPSEYFGDLPGIIWWNKDKTYGLKISLGNPSYLFLQGYVGTPVHVRLPAYYNQAPIGNIGLGLDDDPEIFRNCTTLKSIYIPDTIERIDEYAFDGCTNLETVRFSENLKQIYISAFRNCTSLKTLDFKNTSSIDFWYSFTNCTSLKEIYFPLNTRTYNDSISFENCSLERIYISKEYRSYYINAFASYPNLQIISYE